MIEYGHLIHRFGHLDGEALLGPMLREVFPGRLAVGALASEVEAANIPRPAS